MSRSANYTIKGFLYQFNKTLLEILTSSNPSNIAVEGVIEDIEVHSPNTTKLIQCKYHETNEKYTLGSIYHPLLEMLLHYSKNSDSNIQYILYAYFPNEFGTKNLSIDDVKAALNTKDTKLRKTAAAIDSSTDISKFLDRFVFECGKSMDELTTDVHSALKECGMPSDDIETLIYPNAFHRIAVVSTNRDPKARFVKKKELISSLKKVRKTTISSWTLNLSTRKKLLSSKQKQLKTNLSTNSRKRYFLISEKTLDDFRDEIVKFIVDYLAKYHSKKVHISTPLFCLDCTQALYDDIRIRLYRKEILVNDGYIAHSFFKDELFKEPVEQKIPGREVKRDFMIRLARWDDDTDVLNYIKCDDLFIIANDDYSAIDPQDVNKEFLTLSRFSELKYVLKLCEQYD